MDIEEVRIYCLTKRGVTEDSAFGPNTILFRLCGKIFSCLDLSRPNIVVLKMKEEDALERRERYQGVTGAWHWNKRYWSDVSLDMDLDETVIRQWIDDAYELIRQSLPKKTLYNFLDLPEGWGYEHYPVLDSAMNIIRQPQDEWKLYPYFLVSADFQTAGRGQGKNTWESEDKKNLLFAFRFFPTWVKAVNQFDLLQCISVAVAKALEKCIKKEVQIKWPNDIYIGEHKVCGILIEHDLCGPYLSETRCGIGIDVNQREFHGSAPNPISLYQILGKEVDRAAVLRNFLKDFMQEYSKLKDEGAGAVVQPYLRRLYRSKGWFPFGDKNGKFEACISKVRPDGCLVLKDKTGRERIYAHKQVEFILTKTADKKA